MTTETVESTLVAKPAKSEEPSGYDAKLLVRVLQAAKLAMSDDDERVGLNCLSFVEEKHRLIVESTNGHLCLRIELQRYGDPLKEKRERRRVPSELISLAIETIKVGEFIAPEIPEECTEAQDEFPFPDLDMVFPEKSTDAAKHRLVGYHPIYVETLGKIAKRLRAMCVRWQWPADSDSPMRADLIAADDGIAATFSLMPMRF